MKYLLFIFNFVFFVCGAAILGVGIWVKVDPKIADYVGLTVDAGSYEAATILLIVVGAFILLVGFLGCCGACKESSCMLCLFAGLMVVIVLLQIVAAVLAIVYQSEVESELKKHLTTELKSKVTDDTTDPFTQAVARLQMEFECCGSDGYSDYGTDSKIFNTSGKNVPKSCCEKATGELGQLDDTEWETCSKAAEKNPPGDGLKNKGCYDSLLSWIQAHAVIVVGIGFGLAFVEIMGIVFACCVRNKISEGTKY